jgi:SAM-dependent methyltransferase
VEPSVLCEPKVRYFERHLEESEPGVEKNDDGAEPGRILTIQTGSPSREGKGTMHDAYVHGYDPRESPGAKITAIDISEASVAQARKAAAAGGIANVAFRQGDIFSLPFPPASFDHASFFKAVAARTVASRRAAGTGESH